MNRLQFAAPVWVECVQKLGEQVEVVLRRVAIEHQELDQMDVAKPQQHANVEERLTTVHTRVRGKRDQTEMSPIMSEMSCTEDPTKTRT